MLFVFVFVGIGVVLLGQFFDAMEARDWLGAAIAAIGVLAVTGAVLSLPPC